MLRLASLYAAAIVVVLALGSAPARAQSQINVQIENIGFSAVYVVVVDNECRIVRFRGMLARSGRRSIQLCAGPRGRGSVTILDAYGHGVTRQDLVNPATVHVRFPQRR